MDRVLRVDEASQELEEARACDGSLCEFVYARKKTAATEPLLAMRSALRAGALDLNERCGHVGRTPLMLCAQNGWTGCVELLLSAGADATLRDERGRDALMLSLIARRVDCAKALAPRSNLKARDADGRAPLVLAVAHAPQWVDRELLEALWSPCVDRWRDNGGRNALEWAVDQGVELMVDWLLAKRAAARAAFEARSLARCSVPAPARAKNLRM